MFHFLVADKLILCQPALLQDVGLEYDDGSIVFGASFKSFILIFFDSLDDFVLAFDHLSIISIKFQI